MNAQNARARGMIRPMSRRHQRLIREIGTFCDRMKELTVRYRLEMDVKRAEELHEAIATGADIAPLRRRWESEDVRRVWTECQVYCIEATKLQKDALALSRHAYLDERGAGEMMDAAHKLRAAASMLATVSLKVRREAKIARRELPAVVRATHISLRQALE